MKRRERRRDLIRIGIAAAATGNIMILAVSLYAGAQGILATEFRWLCAALATPVLTYCAWPFYKNTWMALRSRHLNIDVPIVAALIAGFVISIWSLIEGSDMIYFDSLSTLVFLLLSSRFWLKGVQQHLLDVSNLEEDLLSGTVVRILDDGHRERVSSLSLAIGDIVEVGGEGFTIPIDGLITHGHGLIDTSVMTGESEPLPLREGQKVEAGSRTLGGTFTIRVERPVAQTRLAEILRDTENSARAKPRLVQFADKVSQWFISVVLLAAAATAIVVSFTSAHEGIARALALIIVTCPCVFGMAIPLSMSLAIRSAARRGIVIKDADAIERLSEVKTIYFDKTGTLTRGELHVIRRELIEPQPQSQSQLQSHLAAVLALEADQVHPIARALIRSLADLKLPSLKAENVRPISGGGIEGDINGLTYSIRPLGHLEAKASEIRARYGLFCGAMPIARFEIGDQIRPESSSLINWARERGLVVRLLSGDKKSIVAACAAKLDIAAHETLAEATPEIKSALLKENGARSAMVGDGANDAAALASAGVGIAVRGSLDISLRAADVYLSRPDLRSIPELFAIARATRGAITRNLVFSASFNLVSGALAITGYMSPLWAAVLMPISSLTVLLSALATGHRLDREVASTLTATSTSISISTESPMALGGRA